MDPYFFTNHFAGLLLLVATQAWGMMELSQRSANLHARDGAAKIRSASGRFFVTPCIVGTSLGLYLAPHVVAAAAIRPEAAAFAAGLVILLAGLVLRGWSFKALGQYFTHTVMVSSDQPVIASGPYRLLRHPSYTGVLLACMGIGLAAANWVSVATLTLLPLAFLLWRIHVEENALLATVGDRYRSYASQHKRLVPLVW
jgi:protein-S-isoprenylcysteine O-methyltransferase Ste14